MIEVCTHNTPLKNRLAAFAEEYPSECRLIDDDENGCQTYEIRKGRFGFKPVFEWRVVGADFNHIVCIGEKDTGCFLFLGKTCFHKIPLFFISFCQLYTCKKWAISRWRASKRSEHRLKRSRRTKCNFCSSTRDLAGIVPIAGFIAVRIENMP